MEAQAPAIQGGRSPAAKVLNGQYPRTFCILPVKGREGLLRNEDIAIGGAAKPDRGLGFIVEVGRLEVLSIVVQLREEDNIRAVGAFEANVEGGRAAALDIEQNIDVRHIPHIRHFER